MTSSFSVEGTASVKDEMGDARKFSLGERVTKTKGASWTGRVVGFYETGLTPIGYAVESEKEPGSVQIYPEAALAAAPSRDQVTMGALPSPCSLSMKDGALLVAFNTDEEAERVYNLLGGPPSSLVPTAEQGVEAPLRFCDYCKSWHSKPCGNGCVWQPDMPTELPEPTPRTCTCHRDDSPPVPCAENYAFSECSALTPPIAGTGEEVAWRWRLKYQDRDEWTDWQVTAQRRDYDGPDERIEEQPLYSAALISQLNSRIGELEKECTASLQIIADERARAEAAEAKLAEAREVIEPFAHIAENLKPEDGGTDSLLITEDDARLAEISLSCFWAARSFHSPKEPNGGGE